MSENGKSKLRKVSHDDFERLFGIDSGRKPLGFGGDYVEPTAPTPVIERPKLSDLDPNHHPKVAEMVAAARLWNQRRKAGETVCLALLGSVGIGKTHIAKSMMWAMADCLDGEPIAPAGRFFLAPDMLNALADTQFASMIGGAPFIAIDDVGTETSLRFVAKENMLAEIQTRYFRVIDYCTTNRISMVITSNMTAFPEQGQMGIQQYFGVRSWSRLKAVMPTALALDLGSQIPDYRPILGGRE